MDNTCTNLNIPDPKTGRVIIIGGGFGGIAAAKELSRSGLQVVMFDRNNFHQFQPLLYQVATAGLEATSISFPMRAIIAKFKNFYFRMAKVTAIDRENNLIRTSIGNITYDHLIIAAGADTNFFGLRNIEQNSFPLKSIREALALRNHIFRTLEMLLDTNDPEERNKLLTFVIVGGGATGIELAGALAELRKFVLPRDYAEIDFSLMKIYLINATTRLLESFDKTSSENTLQKLRKMGIEVILDVAVNDYKDNIVHCANGMTIPSKTLIWASGITAIKFEGIDTLGRGARIKVDKYNIVENSTNIYAIGDIAIMCDTNHPQVAQVAIQEGRNVGKNLVRLVRNKQPHPFVYNDKGSMATIGRNAAVAEIGKFKFTGFLAWIMWLFIHLLFIISVRNKIRIVSDWAWSYITREQPHREIVEPKRKNDT